MAVHFDEDQLDCLQEVANIGMGRAGAALGRLFGRFIQLSVPTVELTEASEVSNRLRGIIDFSQEVSVVRQGFSGDLKGEALVFIRKPDEVLLADLFAVEAVGGLVDNEAMIDLGNLIAGACIGGLTEQVEANVSWARPSLRRGIREPEALAQGPMDPSVQALVIDISFQPENVEQHCHLVIFMPEHSIVSLRGRINTLLGIEDDPMPAVAVA